MNKPIKERSALLYFVLSFLTFGIYHIVFMTKLSKDVNVLCEGDGKKTMKYVFVWLLNIVTFGIFGLIWKFMLANRLQANAPRYSLKFSEGGALVLVYNLILPLIGLAIAQIVLIKNFNNLAKAYNEYNGLVDPDANKRVGFFADEEEVEA